MSKQKITINLDEEILTRFKEMPGNYQTNINQALLSACKKKNTHEYAETIFNSLNKLKKNRYQEFNRLCAHINNNEVDYTYADFRYMIGALYYFMPDRFINLKDLDEDFIKYGIFEKMLLKLRLLINIGQLASYTQKSTSFLDVTGYLASAMYYLDVTFKQILSDLENNNYIMIPKIDIMHDYVDWEEDFDLQDGNYLAPLEFKQYNESLDVSLVENYVRNKALINLYKYHAKSQIEQEKDTNYTKYLNSFLRGYYTCKIEHDINYGGLDSSDVPNFVIFKIILSEQIKSSKEEMETTLREYGYIWDISAFIIPTTIETKPCLDEDGGCLLACEAPDFDYIDFYCSHIDEIIKNKLMIKSDIEQLESLIKIE